MLPENFNLVLAGENFPVHRIQVSSFEFNHRQLNEVAQIPNTINAATRGAALQIRPDRIQASVGEVRELRADVANLVNMIDPIFEYVGPKSFSAAGHNAQFALDATIPKTAVAELMLNTDAANAVLAGEPAGADVNLYRTLENGATLRTSILTNTPVDRIVLDFNAHFELGGSHAASALQSLEESLDLMVEIAMRTQSSLSR